MNKVSLSAQLCIFGAVFIIGLIAVALCNSVLAEVSLDARNRILIVSVLQDLLAFCLPSVIIALFQNNNFCKVLSLDKIPTWQSIAGVIIAYLLGFAFFNQIIDWNQSITLPESMSAIESSLRSMENNALETTALILEDTSVWGLLSGILVVGVITGFSEELFFRAGLQRLLGKAMSGKIAIWVTAIIFSTLHFQFFGFIPRLLLGAFLGYLYYWTGSIWVSIFAHALNNSLVVITEWLKARDIITHNIDKLGVTDDGFPIYALISLCLFSFYIWKRKIWFRKTY